MVDLQTVCCMCGDVGFADKLFCCNKCRNRFQHSYCSNYYGEFSGPIEVCDWCQSEEKSANKHGGSSKKSTTTGHESGGVTRRSEYSVDKIKNHDRQVSGSGSGSGGSGEKVRSPGGGGPCPRSGTKRYKLLKDVMC